MTSARSAGLSSSCPTSPCATLLLHVEHLRRVLSQPDGLSGQLPSAVVDLVHLLLGSVLCVIPDPLGSIVFGVYLPDTLTYPRAFALAFGALALAFARLGRISIISSALGALTGRVPELSTSVT